MRRSTLLAGLTSSLAAASVPALAVSAPPRFVTGRPAALKATATGVKVRPLMSAGDVIGRFQMTGNPDGGGLLANGGAIEYVFGHEVADQALYPGLAGYPYGARVTRLTLNRDGSVRAGRHIVRGTEGYVSFCSGNVAVLDGRGWYLTGEEGTFGIHGGVAVAVDVLLGTFKDLPWFGYLAHEQELPMDGLGRKTFLLSEDGPASTNQLYAFTSRTWSAALDGVGQLRVFVPDGAAPDGDWSSNDIARGQTIRGRFVALDQDTENVDAATLEGAAQAKGAFDFVRVEDIAASASMPGVAYVADTGAAGHQSVRGRIYRVTLDRTDPRKVSMTLLLDGDAGDNIVNPDNLAASARSLMIQEDRNPEHRFSVAMGPETGYSRVIAYDLRTRRTRAVARVNTTAEVAAAFGEGVWESSGIAVAAAFWGAGWWVLTVQQHRVAAPQAGNPRLVPNTAVGEAGQVLRLYVPGT